VTSYVAVQWPALRYAMVKNTQLAVFHATVHPNTVCNCAQLNMSGWQCSNWPPSRRALVCKTPHCASAEPQVDT
jgi:hypothetical protein